MHDSQTLFFFTVWVWTVWDVSFHLTVHLSVLKASRRHHPFSVLTRKPSNCPLRWKHHWTFAHSRPGLHWQNHTHTQKIPSYARAHTHTHTHTHTTHSRWEEQWPLKLLFFNMRRCLDCPLLFFIFSVGLLFRDKLHNLCGHDHMSKVKKM